MSNVNIKVGLQKTLEVERAEREEEGEGEGAERAGVLAGVVICVNKKIPDQGRALCTVYIIA